MSVVNYSPVESVIVPRPPVGATKEPVTGVPVVTRTLPSFRSSVPAVMVAVPSEVSTPPTARGLKLKSDPPVVKA